jgi:hypothetical protein
VTQTELLGEMEALIVSVEADMAAGWMPPTMRAEGRRAVVWGSSDHAA